MEGMKTFADAHELLEKLKTAIPGSHPGITFARDISTPTLVVTLSCYATNQLRQYKFDRKDLDRPVQDVIDDIVTLEKSASR